MRRVIAFCLVCCAALVCRGAALEKDLGEALAYFRISELPADEAVLNKALGVATAVVDLRYAQATPTALQAVTDALSAPTARRPRLRMYLLNEHTAPALRALFAKPGPGELTIGPARPGLDVDIAVTTGADEQRKAFDGLAQGVALDKLLSSNTAKRRFDEAALARSHATGSTTSPTASAETEEPEPESRIAEEPASDTSKERKVTAPVDFVLQKAVQLHRALVVARK